MLSDVRNYYGLARDFGQAGYFETEHSEQIVRELKLEIKAGKLVALSGIIGSGKSTMLRRIQEALSQDKEILASKSLSVEKGQISLATLIMALFYDLATRRISRFPLSPKDANAHCAILFGSGRSRSPCSSTMRMICTARPLSVLSG
jgi:type II secretory pathway predicted ATPase ExeA